ncbi:RNA binding protein [Plasmodium malariae]|nr:RNA binding protein [Plasmodium malariae]
MESIENGKKRDKYKRGGAGGRYGRNYKSERSESVIRNGREERGEEQHILKKDKDDYTNEKEGKINIDKNDRELSTRGDDEDGQLYKSDKERSTDSTNIKDKSDKNSNTMNKNDEHYRSRSSSVKPKSYKRNMNRRRVSKVSEGSSVRRDLRDSYCDDNINNDKWSISKKACINKCNSTESGA